MNNNFNEIFSKDYKAEVTKNINSSNIKSVSDEILEAELYKYFLSKLPISQQDIRKNQERNLRLAKEWVNFNKDVLNNLKNGLDNYDLINDIKQHKFPVNWVIPVVLDKQKVFKKISVDVDTNNKNVVQDYLDKSGEQGVELVNFNEQLDKQIQLQEQFKKNQITVQKYYKDFFNLTKPYDAQYTLDKKDFGYLFNAKEKTNVLRYFNMNNIFWNNHFALPSMTVEEDEYNEEGKYIKSKDVVVHKGDPINLVGFLVLNGNEDIWDAQVSKSNFFRCCFIGDIENIEVSKNVIITLKNHNLVDDQKIDITDNEILNGVHKIKVIDNDKILIVGNYKNIPQGGQIYANSLLSFEKVIIPNTVDKKNKALFYFFNKKVSEEEYEKGVEVIMPSLTQIINSEKEKLMELKTISEFNAIMYNYHLNFNNLHINQFDLIKNALEKYYNSFNKKKNLKQLKKTIENFDKDVKEDIVFGDKFIFNETIKKYYGIYPNYQKYGDSAGMRFNWIQSRYDQGILYYLIVSKEITGKTSNNFVGLSELKKELANLKKQLNSITKFNCNINPTITYDTYDDLVWDNMSNKFKDGDIALLKNGNIYIWKGDKWRENPLVSTKFEFCLFGGINDNYEELIEKSKKHKKEIENQEKREILEELIKQVETSINEMSVSNLKNIDKKIAEAKLNLQIILKRKEKKVVEKIEIFKEDIEPLMLDILKISNIEAREVMRFSLIKNEGLIIGNNIYDVYSKKKICCAHYYFNMLIYNGIDPSFSLLQLEKLATAFGYIEANQVYCNNCGYPLDEIDYDVNEGISKVSGTIMRSREIMRDDEYDVIEEVKEEKDIVKTTIVNSCDTPELRKNLLNMGVKPEQMAKIKDFCSKVLLLLNKMKIEIDMPAIIQILIDVLQKIKELPTYDKFKKGEEAKLLAKKINLKKISPKFFEEKYANLVNERKINLVGARVLLYLQNVIPVKVPKSGKTKASFITFDGEQGILYISNLIEESKVSVIKKTSLSGDVYKEYIPLERIIENVKKSYNNLKNLPHIRKERLKKERYTESIDRKIDENMSTTLYKTPEAEKVELQITKDIKSKLLHRVDYLNEKIIENIETVITKQKTEIYDPREKTVGCCIDNSGKTYLNFIEENGEKIKEKVNEVIDLAEFSKKILERGVLMRHYFQNNSSFHIETYDVGIIDQEIYRQFFLTYINEGKFKGMMHEFNNFGICRLTGESKKNILEKNYTRGEFDNLVSYILNKNLIKLTHPKKEDEPMKIEELTKDTRNLLDKLIKEFVNKIAKLIGKDNKKWKDDFESKIINLGYLEKRMKMLHSTDDSYKLLVFEDNNYRSRIAFLKRIYNDYFRKNISRIANNFNPNLVIKRLRDIPEDESKEIQKEIYKSNEWLEKYINEKNSKIFSQIKFNHSLYQINNLEASPTIWDYNYDKVKKQSKFSLLNEIEALIYLLISELFSFLNKERTIAFFIEEQFREIFSEMEMFNVSLEKKELDIAGSWKAEKIGEKIKDKKEIKGLDIETENAYNDIKEKMKVTIAQEDENEEEVIKKKFINEYKENHEVEPTENQILDYVENYKKEKKADKEIEKAEGRGSLIREGMDTFEIGNEYGELAQGDFAEDDVDIIE